MVHKKDMGKMGEAMVIQESLRHGMSVFVEFGDNSRIDLIIEDSSKQLHRVQVKVTNRSPRHPDVSTLYLYKSGPNYRFQYSKEDVDWFALVDNDTMKIAWIPSTVCDDNTGIVLRHAPPKSSQVKGIRMFDDYTTFPFK